MVAETTCILQAIFAKSMIVFNNKKFLDYLKEICIHPSRLLRKLTKSDHLADYLDLAFIMGNRGTCWAEFALKFKIFKLMFYEVFVTYMHNIITCINNQ